MLQSLTKEIAACYQKAGDCRARAERSQDPAQRKHYRDAERRWLLLAKSHEMQQRLTHFTAEVRRRLHGREPLHPAIPRVMCPDCGRNMRLARMEPTGGERRADKVSFQCDCGFELQQTIDRVD